VYSNNRLNVHVLLNVTFSQVKLFGESDVCEFAALRVWHCVAMFGGTLLVPSVDFGVTVLLVRSRQFLPSAHTCSLPTLEFPMHGWLIMLTCRWRTIFLPELCASSTLRRQDTYTSPTIE
jgi:hypothetical protein